jgi:hypothetical protein
MADVGGGDRDAVTGDDGDNDMTELMCVVVYV